VYGAMCPLGMRLILAGAGGPGQAQDLSRALSLSFNL
jgi:hypothetical protein